MQFEEDDARVSDEDPEFTGAADDADDEFLDSDDIAVVDDDIAGADDEDDEDDVPAADL